ncbi:MAG: hypothetical protein U5L76_04170 [Patescibacteria group bacterium]|nr:hypothetical protein [Patescibacteria group bacterium]
MSGKKRNSIEDLGLIKCKNVKGFCSICKTKWREGKDCPNGHKKGVTYFVQERKSNNLKRRRLIKCKLFGNRCNICGSSVDECGICNNQHVLGQFYPV